jgi:hypothetical protein
MKKTFVLTLFLLAYVASYSQSAAIISHSTIASFKVSYKSVPQATLNPNSPGIQSIPQATITLKPNVNVAKIYFKIIDNVTKAVIYEVSYNTNASPVINSSGIQLFKNTNGVITISNGKTLTLRPFLYNIQTEDNLSQLSTIYNIIQ